MKRQSLYFLGHSTVETRTEDLPPLQPGQFLVQTCVSAISPGTEMLFYRGQVPPEMAVDANLAGYQGQVTYPLKYGYAVVGEVIQLSSDVDPAWLRQRVFAFQPHQSHFLATPQTVIPVPSDLNDCQAVMLPNMETAVMLAMDARPMLGERVVVIGLGVVGLLATALFSRFPLARLVGIDPIAGRRRLAAQWSTDQTYHPDYAPLDDAVDPDLILELSGNPDALNLAVKLAGFRTRIVVGSWYGVKEARLDLGGQFHRNRVHIQSSQVSTLEPEHTGRWTKTRRLDIAWSMLREIDVSQMITHRFPLTRAAQAYDLIDGGGEEPLQVILTYDTAGN